MRKKEKTNDNRFGSKVITVGALVIALGLGVTCHDAIFGRNDVDNSSRSGQYNHPTEQVDDRTDNSFSYSGINVPEVFANLPVADESSEGTVVKEDNVEKISCEIDDDCGDGYCWESFCTEGKLGEICGKDGDCLEGTCQYNNFRRYCKLSIEEACASDDECIHDCIDDRCAPGKQCEIDDDCYQGLCIDQFCKSAYSINSCNEDIECLYGCDYIVCNKSPEGEYCASKMNCESDTSTCLNNECVEKLEEGNSCTDEDECLYACEIDRETLQGRCTSGKSEDYCDYDHECISEKCASREDAKGGLVKEDTCLKSARESCQVDNECAFACDTEDRVCTDGSYGKECNSDKECNDGDCIEKRCDLDDSFREVGEKCGADNHCADELFCDDGKCYSREVGLGEKCGDWSGDRKCQDGLTCEASECVPVLNKGDSCCTSNTFSINNYIARNYEGNFLEKGKCEEGLYCQRIETTLLDEGVCTSKINNDEKCSNDEQCQSGVCLPKENEMEYCSDQKANENELCVFSDDCQEGLVCEFLDSEIPEDKYLSSCIPLNSRSIGSPCIQDNSCQSGRCVNPNGESGDKFCLPKLELGQSCRFYTDCISGNCNYANGERFCAEKDF